MGGVVTDREQTESNSRKPKGRKQPFIYIAVAVVGIVIVLILSNMSALLQPVRRLNSVLAPITIGLIVAYLANPLLRLFEYRVFVKLHRRRLNRALSLICTYLLILLMIAGVIWLIVPQIANSVNDLRQNGLSYVDRLIASINNILLSLPFVDKTPENLVSLEKVFDFFLNWLDSYSTRLIGGIGSFAGSMLTVLKNIIVGFFISLYVLLSKDRLNAGCRRVFHALLPEKHEKLFLYYIVKAHSKFGGFFIGKIVDSILIGLLSGCVFAIFDIPYAILVAVIIGITNVIPFFGPFIGAIPSAAIIFINSPMKALLFALLILIIQQFDGNILGPLILGGRTGLSSLGILVAVTVTSGLFGFVGMLIGVPLFAFILAILDDYIRLRLRRKNASVDLHDYYPADAFIKPSDAETDKPTFSQKFSAWVSGVEDEKPGVDYVPSRRHSAGRVFRRALLRIGRYFKRFPARVSQKNMQNNENTTAPVPMNAILPIEPEPLEINEIENGADFSANENESGTDSSNPPPEN